MRDATILMLAIMESCVYGAAVQEPEPCPHQIEVMLLGDSISWVGGYYKAVRDEYKWGQV